LPLRPAWIVEHPSGRFQRRCDGCDWAPTHAREHRLVLVSAIAELEALALDIAEGGESYLGGVRETARRLSGEPTGARTRLDALLSREGL
jgi:hypothetical protein